MVSLFFGKRGNGYKRKKETGGITVREEDVLLDRSGWNDWGRIEWLDQFVLYTTSAHSAQVQHNNNHIIVSVTPLFGIIQARQK